MTQNLLRITSLQHLQEVAQAGIDHSLAECVLLLNGGGRRTKLVEYAFSRNGRHWWVDDMDGGDGHYMTTKQLHEWTHIPEAIEKGVFFLEV